MSLHEAEFRLFFGVIAQCSPNTHQSCKMNVTVDVQDIIFLITTPLSIIGELSVLISFLRYPRQLLFGGAAYVSFIFFQVLSTFFLSSKMFASTIFMVMTRDDPSHINGSSIDADVCFALGIIDQFSYASTVCCLIFKTFLSFLLSLLADF